MGNYNDELMTLIESVKARSNSNDVKIWLNKKAFDIVTRNGFPISKFKHKIVNEGIESTRIFIVPL